MSPKIFFGWLVAAVVSVAAAVAAVVAQPSIDTVRLANEPAFPDLRKAPDAVARITISSPGGSFTLVREDGTWLAPDKFNYRAAQGSVRELIVALADMRLVEAKTKLPARFSRLEVEDVDAENAKSRLVRLEDASGKVLAEAIIGKQSAGYTGGLESGTYLRRLGEEQAWLASGGLTVREKLIEWLDTEIVHLASDSVRRVEIAPAQGEGYTVLRGSAEEEFSLTAPPEGRSVKEGALGRLASALAHVEFTDLMPRDRLSATAAWDRATVEGFDGLTLTADVTKLDGKDWLVLSASTAAKRPEKATEQPADAKQTADQETATAEADPAASPDEAEDPQARASEINARVAGWAYQIQGHVADRLRTPIEKLFEQTDGTS